MWHAHVLTSRWWRCQHTVVADMDLADSKGDFRWEQLSSQLPPGGTLQKGLRGFTDHPNFLVARAKRVRGS